jgi:hypothetical protein
MQLLFHQGGLSAMVFFIQHRRQHAIEQSRIMHESPLIIFSESINYYFFELIKRDLMKKQIWLLFLVLLISGCAGPALANTPTPIMHQIKYMYASNENFCMGEITIQKSAAETEKLVLFPNGSAAEITVSMKDGDRAWMQADYMTSTNDTPCDVICRITLDGVLWKEAKSTGTTGTRAVCEGIVGEK